MSLYLPNVVDLLLRIYLSRSDEVYQGCQFDNIWNIV